MAPGPPIPTPTWPGRGLESSPTAYAKVLTPGALGQPGWLVMREDCQQPPNFPGPSKFQKELKSNLLSVPALGRPGYAAGRSPDAADQIQMSVVNDIFKSANSADNAYSFPLV